MSIDIKTDHKWKNFKFSYEVPEKILASRFDYQNREEVTDGFIEYRGQWYHLDEFMRVDKYSPFFALGYHGYNSETFFSGKLIKISDNGEQYQIADYCS